MDDIVYARYRYFDASAAVKLVVVEPRSDVVRKYFEAGGPFYIYAPCTVEVFSTLKSKHRHHGQLTQQQYLDASYYFSALLRDTIKVEDAPLQTHKYWDGAEAMVKTYGLDLVDALQLYLVAHGPHSDLAGPSRTLLITADRALAEAGRVEGIDVWDCMTEDRPRVAA
jgi:predicted nucleic acid-binding protein